MRPSYLFSLLLILTLSFIYIYPDTNILMQSNKKMPIPKEFAIKKKNRKIHKENRKKYFEMMHKASSNIDWKKVISIVRKASGIPEAILTNFEN